VLRRNDEEATQEFTDMVEVLKYLRAQGERADSRLTIIGFDGRTIIETSI
jgi:exopolysaccharide biosynthesis protein